MSCREFQMHNRTGSPRLPVLLWVSDSATCCARATPGKAGVAESLQYLRLRGFRFHLPEESCFRKHLDFVSILICPMRRKRGCRISHWSAHSRWCRPAPCSMDVRQCVGLKNLMRTDGVNSASVVCSDSDDMLRDDGAGEW